MHDDVYQMYLDEIKVIEPCTEKEERELPLMAKQGDRQAKTRLLEGMLHYVLELTGGFRDKGLPAGDLVQEANVALIMAVEQYKGGDLREQIKAEVERTLEAALEEQKMESRVEEEMLARVNVLKDISQTMAEELGREATVEELAEKMKMSADEIKDIMKLTLDAMSVSPDAEE